MQREYDHSKCPTSRRLLCRPLLRGWTDPAGRPVSYTHLLLELRTLLENLDLNTPTPFATDHATNRFLVAGTLPQDKEKMVSQLDQMLKRFGMELH